MITGAKARNIDLPATCTEPFKFKHSSLHFTLLFHVASLNFNDLERSSQYNIRTTWLHAGLKADPHTLIECISHEWIIISCISNTISCVSFLLVKSSPVSLWQKLKHWVYAWTWWPLVLRMTCNVIYCSKIHLKTKTFQQLVAYLK